SRMTPAEGALYLGVPNVVFVRYIGKPMPSEFEHSARSLSPFKRVVWAINFAPRRKGPVQFNWTSVDEEEHQIIRDMLKRRPNIIGLILDDYFRSSGEKRTATGSAAVAKVKSSFGRAEFWDALYTRDIETTDKAHLDLMDVMTIWTKESKD